MALKYSSSSTTKRQFFALITTVFVLLLLYRQITFNGRGERKPPTFEGGGTPSLGISTVNFTPSQDDHSVTKTKQNCTETMEFSTISSVTGMEKNTTTEAEEPPKVTSVKMSTKQESMQSSTVPNGNITKNQSANKAKQSSTSPGIVMETRNTTEAVQPPTTYPVRGMETQTEVVQVPTIPPQNVTEIEESDSAVQSNEIPYTKLIARSNLIRIPWTSVGGKGEKDSFHLFAAYYDNRNVSLRPAVIVLGYAWNQVTKKPLYCRFRYEDGLTNCMTTPLVLQTIASCFAPNLGGFPYFFFCLAQQHSAPVSVVISDSITCNAQFNSEEIIVRNRNHSQQSSKQFGICVEGPVISHKDSLQDLVEFISINKILGAELITMYIIPERLNSSIINNLLRRYPDVLRLIEWKNLKIWSPLHYYGQFLLVQDCLYRSMYEVEYLFHQDLDEVFIPKGGYNWAEIVPKIPRINLGGGFKYQNAFFTLDKMTSLNLTNYCGDLKIPKYLSRTSRKPCFPGYQYRTKLMTKPSLTLEVGIHDVCATMPGFSNAIPVPTNLAILGHFRNQVPKDCSDRKHKTVSDPWASNYADRLYQEMCNNRTNFSK